MLCSHSIGIYITCLRMGKAPYREVEKEAIRRTIYRKLPYIPFNSFIHFHLILVMCAYFYFILCHFRNYTRHFYRGLTLQLNFLTHLRNIYTQLTRTLTPIVPVSCTWNTLTHTHMHTGVLFRSIDEFFHFLSPKFVFLHALTHDSCVIGPIYCFPRLSSRLFSLRCPDRYASCSRPI